MSKILGVHTPSEIKNYIINGAFDFWQEKGGNVTTVNTATTSSGFSADMFGYSSNGPTVKNYSLIRSTDVPTPFQSGTQAQYSALFTMITGISSFSNIDAIEPFVYKMEGLDFQELHRKTITIGFFIKASIAGIYSVSLRNGSANRSYVTTVTVNSANTHEFKSVNITLDQSGTWNVDNSLGMFFNIGTFSGANLRTASLEQWQTGNFHTASTATNYMATAGATIAVSQISIVKGSLGFGSTGFQRAGKTIQQELSMCQRYYETGVTSAVTDVSNVNVLLINTQFHVSKRSTPSISYNSSTSGGGSANQLFHINGGGNLVMSTTSVTTEGISSGFSSGAVAGRLYTGQYTADARL